MPPRNFYVTISPKEVTLLTTVPLKRRFKTLCEIPPEINVLFKKMRWPQSSTKSLLSLLVDNPGGIQLGTCESGSETIRLSRELTWAGEGRLSLTWRELNAAIIGVRHHLKRNGLPYNVSCSCPDWSGYSYKRGPTAVTVAFVDLGAIRGTGD